MRRFLLAIVAFFAFVLVPLSSCLIQAPGGTQKHHRYKRNCTRTCAAYANRRHCAQRCQVYRNGVCVSYKQVCTNTRHCTRYRSRCR
ncbi:MAG: hypothetical protein KAI47_24380 [Deltaproteobacteria bacterium]|nr:hypothetical protein [Deltaproteobacteria bacterium]